MTTNSHRFMKSGFAIVVLLLLLGGAAFAASKLGGRCSYSRDCIEGYCLNSTCRYPPVLEKFDVFGNCSYTSDCGDGFCKDGQCIIPVVEEFDIFTPAAGIKSGCAGFIENCSGIWCMFCNVTWILLVVGAGAAAFVSRKRGRMLPVFMFLLPVIAGVLFYPVAGFILAVLEIFIIAFLKKPMERIEVSAAELGPKGPGPGFPKGGTPPLGGTPPTSGIPPSSGSFG